MPQTLIDAKPDTDSSPVGTEIDANSSDTSTEETVTSEQQTTFDVIEDVLKSDDDTSEDNVENSHDQEQTTSTEEDDPTEAENAEGEESTEETENTDGEVKAEEFPKEFHEHPRFKELVEQKNEAREQVKQLNESIEEQSQRTQILDAIGQENLETYVNFLSVRETDPETALKIMQPMMQELLEANGYTLSADLKQKVEEGEIDEATAKDLARKDAKIKALERQKDLQQQTHQQTNAESQSKQLVDAGNKWATQKKASDPDYPKLEPMVINAIKAMRADGNLPNVGTLSATMDKIYGDIKTVFKGSAPKGSKKVIKNSSTPNGKEKKVYKGDTFQVTSQIIDDLL